MPPFVFEVLKAVVVAVAGVIVTILAKSADSDNTD